MRNEAGKALMEERCSFGIETGEYQGTGVGKSGANGREVEPVDNATDEEEDQILEQIEIPSTAPLLVFFDIETTGLDIYNDTIIDIAAKVVGATVSQRTYQSLVRTSKTIPERGKDFCNQAILTPGRQQENLIILTKGSPFIFFVGDGGWTYIEHKLAHSPLPNHPPFLAFPQ